MLKDKRGSGVREKIFKVIEASDGNDLWSSLYDYFTMFIIIVSLVPLAFKETYRAFEIIDYICVAIFIFDYLLRWLTADLKFGKENVLSFLRYPFSFMALVDLISILPSLTILNASFKLLRIFRLIRAFRVFRVFKAVRYSKSIRIIADVLKNSKRALASVGTFAIGYILVSALVIFNVEPESFDNFFEAVYWAIVSLTAVGYGDIYPVSVAGQVVTMISSLFGIAIIALPSGIITAGYMKEIEAQRTETAAKSQKEEKAEHDGQDDREREEPAEKEVQEWSAPNAQAVDFRQEGSAPAEHAGDSREGGGPEGQESVG